MIALPPQHFHYNSQRLHLSVTQFFPHHPKIIFILPEYICASSNHDSIPLLRSRSSENIVQGSWLWGYRRWHSSTTCKPSTNFEDSHVKESYPVHHIRYCNCPRYTRLSTTLHTWYSSSPATTADGGDQRIVPRCDRPPPYLKAKQVVLDGLVLMLVTPLHTHKGILACTPEKVAGASNAAFDLEW
jgi:hypothetical protein